jgi:hypothetical protein
VIFGNDARGYATIVIDLLYAIDQGKRLNYLVAHEAHHFYRNQILAFNFPEDSHPDYDLVWVLNQIQAEGIADQVDKRVRFFDDGDLADSEAALTYRQYLAETPKLLRKIDSLLADYDVDTHNATEISKTLRKSVPMSGHPTGYFMTRTIIERLGKEVLLEQVGNPFIFFLQYQQAATEYQDPTCPPFSERTEDLVYLLAEQYRATTQTW